MVISPSNGNFGQTFYPASNWSSYLDAFFITHYLSGADLGVYAVAYQVAGIGLQLPLLVGSVLLSSTSRSAAMHL